MPVKPRKIPMRMCVGCREMKPKATLLRVVRPQEGDAHIDRSGKAAGRPGVPVSRSAVALIAETVDAAGPASAVRRGVAAFHAAG